MGRAGPRPPHARESACVALRSGDVHRAPGRYPVSMGKKLDALLRETHGQLQPNEQILAACLGNYETTYGGQRTRRRGALIATTHRVILHAKHLTTTNTETYAYARIGSVESGKIILSGAWIKLNTTEHTLDLKYILEGDAEAVVQQIRARLVAPQTQHAAPTAPPPQAQSDVAAQIAQLAALRNQGVLSQEQYDAAVSKVVSPQ